MTKCDICPYSRADKNGNLKCPHLVCWLETDERLRKQIYKVIAKCGGKNND